MKSKYLLEEVIGLPSAALVDLLWKADPKIKRILSCSSELHEVRGLFFDHLTSLERDYYNIYSDCALRKLHIVEKNNAKECIRTLRNIIRTENESLTGFSALQALFELAHGRSASVGEGFLCEFIFLFKGINGRSGITPNVYVLKADTARARGRILDRYSQNMLRFFSRYRKGTDPAVMESSRRLKDKILDFFGATEKDWRSYLWHLGHLITDSETLSSLVSVSEEEMAGVRLAEENRIPFQVTPYYLSLFEPGGRCFFDRAVRAQVLPSKTYCLNVLRNREQKVDMDFMGEKSTSPVDGVGRRYPQIVILKPFDSCPQVCVYCQRNWELKELGDAEITKDKIDAAVDWIAGNENIVEVLVTGGDPLTLDNKFLESILGRLSSVDHLERIRIGSRVLVTLPCRIDEGLAGVLAKYHEWGSREICLVTHFEHARELTPDSLEAVKKLRGLGIGVYNQQVFTYFNSFRFETCFLRKTLKLSGVDPYYTFNTKGKEETIDFRVPIARILQERHEEARLLPGIVRTDEPVFNVPKVGKSHLRAWQQHEPIMVLGDGCRVYRFLPWESEISSAEDYIYTDVSIYGYLRRLRADGENIEDYKSIWYYF